MAMLTRSGAHGARSAINVTPLIDVVLVLLIVFMVASPVTMKRLTVELPPDAPPNTVPATTPLKVHVRADGAVTISRNGHATRHPRVELARAIYGILAERPGPVFVAFDGEIGYQDAISAIDTLRGAGATAVALDTTVDRSHAPFVAP